MVLHDQTSILECNSSNLNMHSISVGYYLLKRNRMQIESKSKVGHKSKTVYWCLIECSIYVVANFAYISLNCVIKIDFWCQTKLIIENVWQSTYLNARPKN